MRDQTAIGEIETLNSKSDLVSVKVYDLIKLLPYFSQPTVAAFVEKAKDSLLNVKDLLILAQSKTDVLSNEDIASIAFASVMFGGSAWANLPKMLA